MGTNDMADLKVEEATLRRKVSVKRICQKVRVFSSKKNTHFRVAF